MDGEIEIVLVLDGQWRADGILAAQHIRGKDALKIGSTVAGNRPSLGVVRQGDLSRLVHQTILVTIVLVGNDIAEADTVVEHAEDNLHLSDVPLLFLEGHRQLIVVVAHQFLFAPHLKPCFVILGETLARHLHVRAQHSFVELEAEMRRGDDFLSVATNDIIRLVGFHTHTYRDTTVG